MEGVDDIGGKFDGGGIVMHCSDEFHGHSGGWFDEFEDLRSRVQSGRVRAATSLFGAEVTPGGR